MIVSIVSIGSWWLNTAVFNEFQCLTLPIVELFHWCIVNCLAIQFSNGHLMFLRHIAVGIPPQLWTPVPLLAPHIPCTTKDSIDCIHDCPHCPTASHEAKWSKTLKVFAMLNDRVCFPWLFSGDRIAAACEDNGWVWWDRIKALWLSLCPMASHWWLPFGIPQKLKMICFW